MSSVIARSWARREALPGARMSPRLAAVVAFALYLVFALAITWPFVLHPQSTLFGITGGDLTGQIAFYQQLADAGRPPFLPWTNPDVAFPEGSPNQWQVHAASAPGITVMWLLALVFGGVAMNGLFVLTSFVGTAFAMFLFARWLTGSAAAAFVAGLAFGFAPYVFATASQQLGSGWLLVLLTWRIFVAFERPTTRNALWAALAMVLTLTWVQYWLLIGTVWWASLAACCLVLAWRRGGLRDQLKVHVLIGVITVVILGVGLVLSRSGDGTAIPDRGTTDLYLFSARPLMYAVPSPWHPLFGEETRPWLLERFSGSAGPPLRAAYNPIYLGLVVTFLGLAGLVVAWLRRRVLSRRQRDVVIGLVVAGVVALAFSAPPTIGAFGQTIPLPNKFVGEFTTAFRTTARFGYNVELVVCALAAVALAAALSRWRSAVWAPVVVALVSVAVAVDGWARVPPGTTRVAVPPSIEALADEPAGAVAFYPLAPAAQSASEPIFYRHYFQHPIINNARAGSREEMYKLTLGDLKDPRVPQELARLGVHYAVAVKRMNFPAGKPWEQPPVRGLELVKEDADAVLYRVTAAPATSAVYGDSGFSIPIHDRGYLNGKRYAQWLFGESGTLVVDADCDPCEGTVELLAASYAQGRTLTFTDAATGAVVARRRVEPYPQRLRVPVRFSRRMELRLTPDPPGQLAAEIYVPNHETFSVVVSDGEFKPAR